MKEESFCTRESPFYSRKISRDAEEAVEPRGRGQQPAWIRIQRSDSGGGQDRLCRDTLLEWQPRMHLEEAWGCQRGKVPMFGKYRRRGVGPPRELLSLCTLLGNETPPTWAPVTGTSYHCHWAAHRRWPMTALLPWGCSGSQCCQETQVSRKELQRSKKRSQESASIQSLFPSQKDDCVFITQGSYLIQDPWGKVFFVSLLLIRTFQSKLTISSQRGTFDWEFCCKIICLF